MTFLEISLFGGVFVLAIAAFRALALRRLPKGTFVVLWWVAAARLLLPLRFASRFSVYTLLESLRPEIAAPVAPAVSTAPAGLPILYVPTRPVTAPPPQPEPFPVWTVLWVSVGLLMAAWFLIRYVRWRRRFRESLPADCADPDIWFSLRRKVEVRVTDQIAAPLTYGLLHPVILLPRTLELADEEAVACVLAHELTHIRRLDGLLKLTLTAVLCVHWFNPAAWLLYVLANRDMELRCDEEAVLALGEDHRERYALALLRLAELQNNCVPLCGFAHRNGMEERIKAIMSVKKKSLLACFAALALVLGITTAFATSAKPQGADELYNMNITDGELLAESSAESAARWKETLAPYEPFGLRWTFDDPDLDGNGLTMTWEGHEVQGIYDEETGVWITEHSGNGFYGPDAVELYTVYENGKLVGLRLATKEEQDRFTQDRKLSSDALKVYNLADNVRYNSGHIYFTIPESEEPWSIFIQGRILMEDGSGMSVHYLEEESEKAEWVPGMTYSFEVGDAAFDELTMDVKYGDAAYCYPLTLLLPEGNPLPLESLPEGKADIPEGVAMIWPVDGGKITNSYGDRTKPGGEGVVTHAGVDIGGVEQGTPIYAAGKGTVKEAGYNAQDGNFIRLDHGNGLETFYAHCRSVEVKTGGAVSLGQTIATVGSTGNSTGPHLHFEVLVNGVQQNPESYYLEDSSSAGFVGREENTYLSRGISEKPAAGILGFKPDQKSEIEQYYEAGSLPLFQIALSRLDEERQREWMDKIYTDKDIAFFSAIADQWNMDSPLMKEYGEKIYNDAEISFFSVLADRMSEETLEAWLDRAIKDGNVSFQSVLYDRLNRKDERDALEEKMEKEQLEEYRAVGVTKNGKNYYYQGRLVNVFLDTRANQSFYTLNMNPAGEINIKINRENGEIISSVAYLTDAEIVDLFGQDL